MNMQKLLYLYCLFFLTINASAQEVRGRVMNDTIPLAGTHVLNLANNAVTTTDANGYFSIKARERHTLQFSFVGMQTAYRTLLKTDFGFAGVLIQMKEAINQLEEVEVSKYRKISAQELGIMQKEIVKRTNTEKQLYQATHSGGLPGIQLLVNTLSGRTKMLKKMVANERNVAVANYIVENLKPFCQKELALTDEQVSVLAYFVMERSDFHYTVSQKNNKQLEFMLIEAWGEYQKLAAKESEE